MRSMNHHHMIIWHLPMNRGYRFLLTDNLKTKIYAHVTVKTCAYVELICKTNANIINNNKLILHLNPGRILLL